MPGVPDAEPVLERVRIRALERPPVHLLAPERGEVRRDDPPERRAEKRVELGVRPRRRRDGSPPAAHRRHRSRHRPSVRLLRRTRSRERNTTRVPPRHAPAIPGVHRRDGVHPTRRRVEVASVLRLEPVVAVERRRAESAVVDERPEAPRVQRRHHRRARRPDLLAESTQGAIHPLFHRRAAHRSTFSRSVYVSILPRLGRRGGVGRIERDSNRRLGDVSVRLYQPGHRERAPGSVGERRADPRPGRGVDDDHKRRGVVSAVRDRGAAQG